MAGLERAEMQKCRNAAQRVNVVGAKAKVVFLPNIHVATPRGTTCVFIVFNYSDREASEKNEKNLPDMSYVRSNVCAIAAGSVIYRSEP